MSTITREELTQRTKPGIHVLDKPLEGRALTYCSYYDGRTNPPKHVLANCHMYFQLPIGSTIFRPDHYPLTEPRFKASSLIRSNQMIVTDIVPTDPDAKSFKITSCHEPPAEWFPEWGSTNPRNFHKGQHKTKKLDFNTKEPYQSRGLNFVCDNGCERLHYYM